MGGRNLLEGDAGRPDYGWLDGATETRREPGRLLVGLGILAGRNDGQGRRGPACEGAAVLPVVRIGWLLSRGKHPGWEEEWIVVTEHAGD
jgi:hypothetical protein